MVAQFLAHKPDNFALLKDSYILSFLKLLKFWPWMQIRQAKNCFPSPKIYRDFRETGPRGQFLENPGKPSPFDSKDRGFKSFASSMIELSVSETKCSSLLARTRALILYISIWIFDFGPKKLPGLSRNGPQVRSHSPFQPSLDSTDWKGQ